MDKISVSKYTVDDIMEVERTFSYVSDLEIVLAIIIIQIIVRYMYLCSCCISYTFAAIELWLVIGFVESVPFRVELYKVLYK